MHAVIAFLALALFSPVSSHPIHHDIKELRVVGQSQSAKFARREASSPLGSLAQGNAAFRNDMKTTNSSLLKALANKGQHPPFMFVGCSDSRVDEATVFKAPLGTLFTQRNIANQFQSYDANSQSALSYAVTGLDIEHVIVMGHYGCGGVAASMVTPPTGEVEASFSNFQTWIDPVREIFRTSTRSEIVAFRQKIKGLSHVKEPKAHEPGFRALVEENVKAVVGRIAKDSVITTRYADLAAAANGTVKLAGRKAPLKNVFLHGWVYDMEKGEVMDLGVSVGPPGVVIPPAPFPAVAKSALELHTGKAQHQVRSAASKANVRNRRN